MKLYPPYSEWKTVINDPLAFKQFLQENVDTCDTGRYTKYRGDVSQNGFRIERNRNHYNTNRPQIRGKIVRNASGEQELTLNIESRKTLFYIVLVFSIFLGITGIVQLNPFSLVLILIISVWMYLTGWILHVIELRQTKVELEQILAVARG